MAVRIGVHDQSNTNEGQIFAVKAVYKHPKYNNPIESAHDAALIKLARPVTFNNDIQPVCLPLSDSAITAGTAVTVTGWGTLKEDGSAPSKLQQVTVNVVSPSKCKQQYGAAVDSTSMLCAAAPGKDSCQGDSGGPLVAQTVGTWKQYGIVSFGSGCAQPNASGVYTRVTSVCSWIKQTTGLALCK